MPSENTILNLFRRLFSFFNNSTSHYRLRTRRQKAARFRLPKPYYVRTQSARRTGVLLRIRSLRPLGTGMQLDQYADRETGLHYNFFRYYESDTGRFVNQNLIGLDVGDNLYLFAFNSQIWADALGLPKAPWGKGSFDSWFDSANVADIRKVMADPNTKNAIPNALRNGGGFHEWFPVSMADKLEGAKTKRGAIMRIKNFAEKFTRGGKKSVGGC